MAKHTIRDSANGRITMEYSRAQAIKMHCTACMGYEENPRKCTGVLCELYPFRGKSMAVIAKKDRKEGDVEDEASSDDES